MALEQLPESLEQVVALIIQLYQPGAPEKISRTQETLLRLQRSPQAWQIASSLASFDDEQVQFFAALTFIVKLNTDAKSLTEEDAQALLRTLIEWLIRCNEDQQGPLVTRKLSSTLVAYFLQFSTSWTRCIRHLMYCFCLKVPIPYVNALGEAPEAQLMVDNFTDKEAVALFWFASSFVEEIGRTDSSSMKQHKFHQSVVPNVDDIVPLMSNYLAITDSSSSNRKVRQEAMKCFQSWVSYSHRAFIDDEIVLDPLRTLTKLAIRCLVEDDLYEIAIELFADVLSNYSKFLSKEDFQLLRSLFNSSWAQERYERLVQGDFKFDSIQFGHFTIAFGDATLHELAANAESDPQCQQFLSALGGLLGAEGSAVQDDKIFVPALEFWNTFVENMINEIYTEDGQKPTWFLPAQAHVIQAIETCWRKLQFPPARVFNSWDSVDRTGFKDARRDFMDLLQQFYLVAGIPLLEIFINLTHKSIEIRNWAELETSIYCLTAFSDCVADAEQRDVYLHKIFTLPFFSLFATLENEIPERTTQSFLLLVHGYADYFRQNTTYLPNVLNIVFSLAATPSLSHKASQTILQLCSECRKILLPELSAFMQQYQNIIINSSLDKYAKESIIEGIASLVQAIPDDEPKIVPLEQLLSFIEIDVENCLKEVSSPSSTEKKPSDTFSTVPVTSSKALELGLVSLGCLAGIGKGMSPPNDTPVDLEEEEIESTFWTVRSGSRIQQHIFSMVSRIYGALGTYGDIVDAACHVCRQGLRELEPGPLVLPPAMVAEFLLRANHQTPRLGFVIGTACSFVTSHKHGSGLDEVLDALLQWISSLLQSQEEPGNDPEVAQNGIDFLTRLLSKYPESLMNHQPPPSLEFLFMFTLKAITGSDPLPKLASAEFWTTFIGLPRQADEIQQSLESALAHLGPLLAQALMFNIGGHAARSELDKLSEPLKKLVVQQVHSKSWIETALFGDTFPSSNITAKEKMVFLQKIMNLRGARGTNQVVREFWLACRGTNFAYAS